MGIVSIAHSMNLRFDTKFAIHHTLDNFLEDFTDKIRVSSAMHKMLHQMLHKKNTLFTDICANDKKVQFDKTSRTE